MGGSVSVDEMSEVRSEGVSCKFVLLGGEQVGKSSLFQRMVLGRLTSTFPTRRCDVGVKHIRVARGHLLSMAVWDTPCGTRDLDLYCRDADGCFVVVDSTQPASFAQIGEWMTAFRTHAASAHIQGGPPKPIVLLANKADMLTCVWSGSEIARVATERGCLDGHVFQRGSESRGSQDKEGGLHLHRYAVLHMLMLS
jgi:GTPase SAR1 family protein